LRSQTALFVVLGAMGACWGLINTNSLPLVYDFANEKRIGASTGLYYFASSAAAITGPILAGGLIDLSGKNYTTVWVFSALFMAAALFAMTQVRAIKKSAEAA
jgi:maltose/moltooligosaccharide transporter